MRSHTVKGKNFGNRQALEINPPTGEKIFRYQRWREGLRQQGAWQDDQTPGGAVYVELRCHRPHLMHGTADDQAATPEVKPASHRRPDFRRRRIESLA
jgi:hypothetical protein